MGTRNRHDVWLPRLFKVGSQWSGRVRAERAPARPFQQANHRIWYDNPQGTKSQGFCHGGGVLHLAPFGPELCSTDFSPCENCDFIFGFDSFGGLE